MTSQRFRPGDIVPRSGIYDEFQLPRVKVSRATCVKGEPFPPTEKTGNYYVLAIPTR